MEVSIGKNEKEVNIGNITVTLNESRDSIIAKVEEYYKDSYFWINGVLGIKDAKCYDEEGTLYLQFINDKLGAVKVDLYYEDVNSIVKKLNQKFKELYGEPEYSLYDLQNMYDAKTIIVGIVKVSMGEVAQIIFTQRKS